MSKDNKILWNDSVKAHVSSLMDKGVPYADALAAVLKMMSVKSGEVRTPARPFPSAVGAE